ncbi:CRISPR-associated helicase Cas3 [Citrifermentans bremense]|uniref:CRISPR-associated helicase Cas3 n=1 Tax=Citrifermentans bremense TaxID=60035 RepID=A0A7R7FSZ5_9BACT|nr:DEAD/DEAH box helicase [Citrifermentans bremense]BCO11469.1 CRISPR-associated helicase Cas3 [Citrifermentans bremense]
MEAKSIQQMMPDAWPVFFHHRKLRPLQEKAIPALVRGESVLLSGPTASGKTEAVVAPLFQRHLSFHRTSLAVVYVAPTRALVNDLYYRLEAYLGARSGGAVRRYTGDHHELASVDGIFLLLTTPEALDSLQLVSPEKFQKIRAVVIDEIHLLHGNPRGQQLRHVINRIEHNILAPTHPKDCFQRIGMTATINDVDGVCQRWLGVGAKRIGTCEQREIELTLLDLDQPEKSVKAHKSAILIAEWLDSSKLKKVIVFGNSRNSTQALAAALHKQLAGTRWPVHWHTGILSKSERERIEASMKSDRFGVCIATSTLEVGIDIGDIDAVVLCDPPFSVGSFLQRIGRGNRKTDKCKVVALFQDKQEKLLLQALYQCGIDGVMDDVHEFDRPSVRFQQVLSFAWRGVSRDKKPLLRRSLASATCEEDHAEVVEDMLDTGVLLEIAGALIPSDQFIDLGEKRLIHSVITGRGCVQIADGITGEALISPGHTPNSSGSLFVGGGFRKLVESSTGEMSLEKTDRGPLLQLPSVRGKRWLSRVVVWAIAGISGADPRIWKYSKHEIMTWGGEYNRLLILLLRRYAGNRNDKLKANEYSIISLFDISEITPLQFLEWTLDLESKQNAPLHEVLPFCEKSQFFQYLSPELQRKEAFNSIPFNGFKNWLNDCESYLSEE